MSSEKQRDTLAGEISDVADDLRGIANILTNPDIHDDTHNGWTALAEQLGQLTATLAGNVSDMRRYARATHDATTVQIVQVTDDMPATEEYGGYRGYVLEVDGQYTDNPSKQYGTLPRAQAAAAALTGTWSADWNQASTDGRGAPVWNHNGG